MVRESVDPEDDETDEERGEPRPQAAEIPRQAAGAQRLGGTELQDEDRHRDREDSVDQCLEEILRQRAGHRLAGFRGSPPPSPHGPGPYTPVLATWPTATSAANP